MDQNIINKIICQTYANYYDVFYGKAFNNTNSANNCKEGYTSWWKEAEYGGINK